jgi:17beta-estradiol 17-dehydrogenase / very-long-chain 3-oxoacyl-CoA reductase
LPALLAWPWLVVTGASDGIGREFAIQLAKAGFNVLLAARNQAKLDAVVDDIGAHALLLFLPFLFLANPKKNKMLFGFGFFTHTHIYLVKACGGNGVQTKTFVVDFARADDARWEALLEELKPIEVGVLGASYLLVLG